MNFAFFYFYPLMIYWWHKDCCLRAMIDGMFASANYQGVKKMLDATVLRQEAIASNLANIETPNYKRVDVSPAFPSELSRAIEGGAVKSVQKIKPTISVDDTAVARNRDGNSVQLEKELTYLQKNMVAHHLQTQMITGTLSKLRSAITTR